MSEHKNKKSGLSNLLAIAKAEEEKQKMNIETVTPDTNMQEKTFNPDTELKEEIIEKKAGTNNDVIKFEDFFSINTEYGVGDLNLKIPMSLHKEFKLLSAHSGVPMTKIISNILDDFLKNHKKDITKLMKR